MKFGIILVACGPWMLWIRRMAKISKRQSIFIPCHMIHRKNGECVENMKMTYELQDSKILETLQKCNESISRNVKFIKLFNVSKFKEYEKDFTDFLFESCINNN